MFSLFVLVDFITKRVGFFLIFSFYSYFSFLKFFPYFCLLFPHFSFSLVPFLFLFPFLFLVLLVLFCHVSHLFLVFSVHQTYVERLPIIGTNSETAAPQPPLPGAVTKLL